MCLAVTSLCHRLGAEEIWIRIERARFLRDNNRHLSLDSQISLLPLGFSPSNSDGSVPCLPETCPLGVSNPETCPENRNAERTFPETQRFISRIWMLNKMKNEFLLFYYLISKNYALMNKELLIWDGKENERKIRLRKRNN